QPPERPRPALLPFLVPVLVAAGLTAAVLTAAAGGGLHHQWAFGWALWWVVPVMAMRMLWWRRVGGTPPWRRAAARGPPGPGSARAAEAEGRAGARRLERLRGASMGAAVMLVIQFGLGVGVNLYVTLPAAVKGEGEAGGGRSVGQAFSNGALLALHTVFGLLL